MFIAQRHQRAGSTNAAFLRCRRGAGWQTPAQRLLPWHFQQRDIRTMWCVKNLRDAAAGALRWRVWLAPRRISVGDR